ncbi:MAG TPA: hypothetical protein DIT04_13610 [Dysgonomonas sp.]|nr:hypothetical protein [Dysgonomonas sp.]
MKKYISYILIVLIGYVSFSCRDVLKSPEIKGYIYNTTTLKPEQNVKITFRLTYRFGGGTIPISAIGDSVGFFYIPIYKKFELSLPVIEAGDIVLCSDCVITLEKEGFDTDSVYLNQLHLKTIEAYTYEIDSLFFTARKTP